MISRKRWERHRCNGRLIGNRTWVLYWLQRTVFGFVKMMQCPVWHGAVAPPVCWSSNLQGQRRTIKRQSPCWTTAVCDRCYWHGVCWITATRTPSYSSDLHHLPLNALPVTPAILYLLKFTELIRISRRQYRLCGLRKATKDWTTKSATLLQGGPKSESHAVHRAF